jgi:hypothetical protein
VLAVALGLGVILLWNQFVHNATGIDSDLASAATASTEADVAGTGVDSGPGVGRSSGAGGWRLGP